MSAVATDSDKYDTALRAIMTDPSPGSDDPRAEAWGGSSGPERRGDEVRTVPERAVETAAPYRRRGAVSPSGPALAEQFRSREYRYASLEYDATLLSRGGLKLLVKGTLWGSDDRDQRYRVLHRRDPEPTESVPFDEYRTWVRYQYGDVADGATPDDGVPPFAPETEATDDSMTLSWSELFPLHRRLLIELELARNPAFAEYRLRELDEWDDARDRLKWDREAFTVGP